MRGAVGPHRARLVRLPATMAITALAASRTLVNRMSAPLRTLPPRTTPSVVLRSPRLEFPMESLNGSGALNTIRAGGLVPGNRPHPHHQLTDHPKRALRAHVELREVVPAATTAHTRTPSALASLHAAARWSGYCLMVLA
jgi:hypothetical protein